MLIAAEILSSRIPRFPTAFSFNTPRNFYVHLQLSSTPTLQIYRSINPFWILPSSLFVVIAACRGKQTMSWKLLNSTRGSCVGFRFHSRRKRTLQPLICHQIVFQSLVGAHARRLQQAGIICKFNYTFSRPNCHFQSSASETFRIENKFLTVQRPLDDSDSIGARGKSE